jgi:hypothetical protein
MGECFKRAVELGIVSASANPHLAISRADCYAGLVRVMEILGNAEVGLPTDVEVHPVG